MIQLSIRFRWIVIKNCKRYQITSLLQIDCLKAFEDKELFAVMNSNEVDA